MFLSVRIYGFSNQWGYITLAQQDVNPGNPRYDISWSGSGYDRYELYAFREDSYSKVYLWKQFIPSSGFEYDIGSGYSTSPPLSPPFSSGGTYDRPLMNVKHQCAQMHDFFYGIDSSYSKAKVNVRVVDALNPNPAVSGLTWTGSYFELYGSPINNYSGSTSPDVIRHEYTHTVELDIYQDRLDNDAEERAMSEAFAYYYSARSLGDDPAQTSPAYSDRFVSEPILATDITSYPYHWSQYSPTGSEHWNARILASTMWDVARGSNPQPVKPTGGSNPQPVKPTGGWDEIMWLVLNQEPRDHAQWRDELEYWSLQWGGSSYQSFAWTICDQHGLPSRYHPPYYDDPHD